MTQDTEPMAQDTGYMTQFMKQDNITITKDRTQGIGVRRQRTHDIGQRMQGNKTQNT